MTGNGNYVNLLKFAWKKLVKSHQVNLFTSNFPVTDWREADEALEEKDVELRCEALRFIPDWELLVLNGSPKFVKVMLPGDIVCVASISAFKSPAIKNYGKLIDHTYTGQGPLITDGRNTNEMFFFQNIRRKDDLGISKVMKISLITKFKWHGFQIIRINRKKFAGSGTTLLSRPHELGHFLPFFTIQSQGI